MAHTTLKIKIDLTGEAATIQEIKEALAQADQADLAALVEATVRLHIGSLATAADYEMTTQITPPSPGRPGRTFRAVLCIAVLRQRAVKKLSFTLQGV